jgi:hypothetical protein
MESLSPAKRLYFGYLSRIYALAHSLNRHTFLGIRLSTMTRWLPLILLLIGWRTGWAGGFLIILAVVTLWIHYSLWRAKRDNYLRFVADGQSMMASETNESLPPNQKVPITASGLFSVTGRENRLLHRPANYWYVPLGEHIVMAEEIAGKYLYQFFNPKSLQEIRRGWLLHGSSPILSLEVSFLSKWGPEYTRFGQLYESGQDDESAPKLVTIYLSSSDEEVREAIGQTIVREARRVREET